MLQPLGDQHQNLIYLYDLPKADISSKKIAEAFKNQAQVHLDIQPQLRRDITRPFYTAIVNIKDSTQFE
jgi:polyadenylate-binding protein